MIPSVSSSTLAPKSAAPPAPATTANKTAQPEMARSSVGEAAPRNIRAETTQAVDATEQTTLMPRLRDQETAERTNRTPPDTRAPAGPPPAFEESPLERQARVAFDPPEPEVDRPAPKELADGPDLPEAGERSLSRAEPDELPDPPPTPSERAETSFAETRAIADDPGEPSLDLTR